MNNLFLFNEKQMSHISPFFPLAHGVPRADDLRIVSRIAYVIRYGLQWRDPPKGYGPHKNLYNRFIHWSRLGTFDRILRPLQRKGQKQGILIDSTHLKAHRATASLLKNDLFPSYWTNKG